MIFFSSQFSNWELWTLRNVFKIVNRRFLANFCVFYRDTDLLLSLSPMRHLLGVRHGLMPRALLLPAVSRQRPGAGLPSAAVCNGWQRCIPVTRCRAAGRGTALCSVRFAAASCCVRHGDEVDSRSLCCPLRNQADGASPPGESYVSGVLPAVSQFWCQQWHSYFSHCELFSLGSLKRPYRY